LQTTVDNDIRLIVDKSCRNVDISFRRYKYKEYGGKRAEEMSLSEMLEGKYKHFMGLIRYDAMLPFYYSPYEEHFDRIRYSDYGEGSERQQRMPERPTGADAY